jgi:hypothetical protein
MFCFVDVFDYLTTSSQLHWLHSVVCEWHAERMRKQSWLILKYSPTCMEGLTKTKTRPKLGSYATSGETNPRWLKFEEGFFGGREIWVTWHLHLITIPFSVRATSTQCCITSKRADRQVTSWHAQDACTTAVACGPHSQNPSNQLQ